MDQGDPACLVGMGVDRRGAAVGRPAGVSDAAAALQGRDCLGRGLTEVLKPPFRFQNPDALRAGDGDARRVVAPVFQSGKGVQEKLPGVFKAGISNDSTI